MADEEFTPEELELLDEMIADLKAINQRMTDMIERDKNGAVRFNQLMAQMAPSTKPLNNKTTSISNIASAGEKNSSAGPVLIDVTPLQPIPSETEFTMVMEQKEDQLEDLVDESLDLVHSKREMQVLEPLNNGGLVADIGDRLQQSFVPKQHDTEVSLEPILVQIDENQLLLLNPVFPRLPPKPPDVNYCIEGFDFKLVIEDLKEIDYIFGDVCGVLVPYPGTEGVVLDYGEFIKKAHANGVKVVMTNELLALTVLKPPGELGADMVVVSYAQRFGVPMGYANLARLDHQYGLYTRVVPHLIYAVKGSSGEVAIGPVAVVSLLIYSQVSAVVDPAANPEAYRNLVFTTTLTTGIFQAAFGVFMLDFLVDFLSHAALVGFMAGVIGVKRYFPEIGKQYQDFYHIFHRIFSQEYPGEFNNEPGIFAANAYDATWTVALANNFTGLNGKFPLTDHKLAPADTVQIINVIEKGYKEIGFWSDGLGFSNDIVENATYNSSMEELGQVLWPGRAWGTPRGWTLLTSAQPLRIGVPALATLKQFINIIQDPSENTTFFQGFIVDFFKATVDLLPYHFPYKFYAFNDTYDKLVKQIYLKNFDAVIDVTIISYRYQYAEFTQPYTDPGVVMVVPIKSKAGSRAWLFVMPFTKTMWILIVFMIIYNGFILWMLERQHCPALQGSTLNQTGSIAWLVLTPLLNLNGDKFHNNLSRVAMVVWLFLALIITQTYTANLASMLAAKQLELMMDDGSMVLVFHISQLQPFRGPAHDTYLPLPLVTSEWGPILQPEAALDSRTIIKGHKHIPQVLIKWSDDIDNVPTWEHTLDIQLNYPNFNLEDKVVFKGEGIVMNPSGSIAAETHEKSGNGQLAHTTNFRLRASRGHMYKREKRETSIGNE